MELRGKNVLVVGLGTSGSAAIEVLLGEGARVRLSETRSDISESDMLSEVDVRSGGHDTSHLDGMELVVASPGVPQDASILVAARAARIPIWSELELGATVCTVPYVAVTGTNGKTTTTEMIASAMRESGADAVACGNIGHPFSLAAKAPHDSLAVEASSFQLRHIETFRPRVSVLLNVAPDHLDWHGGFDSYVESKIRVFENQSGDDVHVANADDPLASAASSAATCRMVSFTLGYPGQDQVGFDDGVLLGHLDSEVHMGRPASTSAGFMADAAAAAAASLAFGIEPEDVTRGIARVSPLPHRGEVVSQIGSVTFVDDSKATNPHAALASLEGRSDVVLIAGGLSKGVDLSPLATAVDHLKGVVAIGEAGEELRTIFEGLVPVAMAGSMNEAVSLASLMAEGQGTVLLAPACASQDMFTDYKERGERFASAVRSLQGSAA